MKRQLLRAFTLLIFFGQPVVAQVFPPTPGDLKVIIPFDFLVGDKTMRAGNYIIHKTKVPAVLQICEEGIDCATVATIPVAPLQTATKRQLVFQRSGNQYSLFQVWLTSQAGRQVKTSSLVFGGTQVILTPEFVHLDAQLLCIHFTKGFPSSWH